MTRRRAGPIRMDSPGPRSNGRTPLFGRKLAPSRTMMSRRWVRTSDDPTAGAANSTDSAGSRTASIASRAASGRCSQEWPPRACWASVSSAGLARAPACIQYTLAGRSPRQNASARPRGGRGRDRSTLPGRSTRTSRSGVRRPPRSRRRRPRRASPSPIGPPRSPGCTRCPSGSGSPRRAPTSVAASTAVVGPSRSGPAQRSPPSDRQERDIDAAGQPGHPGVQGRIPGEVHAHRPLDQVADRPRAAVPQPASMPGGDGGHAHAARSRPAR